MSSKRFEEAKQLYKSGLTDYEISCKMGISPNTVKAYLSKSGVRRQYTKPKSQKQREAYQSFEVISVPDDIFVIGARFDKTNVDFTLQVGAWPIGLQFLDRKTGDILEASELDKKNRQYLKFIRNINVCSEPPGKE